MITPKYQNITAVSGQSLSLSVEFCANPVYDKVFWIAKDKVVVPGKSNGNALAYDITVRRATNKQWKKPTF